MTVNPQLFNYRLVIGSLVIVIVMLGSYGYKSFEKLKDHEAFIQQEKRLVENELSEMINSYKTINIENYRVNNSLEGTKDKLNTLLDSITLLPANTSLITHYKFQLRSIRKENEKRLTFVDSLTEENNRLKQLASNYKYELDHKDIVKNYVMPLFSVPNIKSKSTLLIDNSPSIIKNDEQEETTYSDIEINSISNKKPLTTAKTFGVIKIKAQGIKRITPKRIINTKIAARANQVHVSFTIPKSKLIDKGDKAVYIQILDPNSNIVGDKGVMSFGDLDLIYSKKTIVNYEKENFRVSTLIKTNSNEPLITGSYLVNIFHNENRVGKTSIYLK